MNASERDQAQDLLEKALRESGNVDPREVCRERLRELKEMDRSAYDEAVRHYEETLVTGIASGALEPLTAWTEYSRLLAELSAPGRTVAVDSTGRASPYDPASWRGQLVLHLPTGRGRAMLVALPAEASASQLATYRWLVEGRQRLEGVG